MVKTIVHTPEAPEAIGPYSQAVTADGWVFCSGQIPIDPASGEILEGSIRDQTERCCANLAVVLESAGSGWPEVVKVTVYLVDINDFPEFNDAYSDWVGEDPPARATVGVSALPKGARVEIECVARTR